MKEEDDMRQNSFEFGRKASKTPRQHCGLISTVQIKAGGVGGARWRAGMHMASHFNQVSPRKCLGSADEDEGYVWYCDGVDATVG